MLEMKDLLVQSADKVILDRVSLSLAEGESLSIVGESGSGKSTLLKMLLGLPLRGLKVAGGSMVFAGRRFSPKTIAFICLLWAEKWPGLVSMPVSASITAVRSKSIIRTW